MTEHRIDPEDNRDTIHCGKCGARGVRLYRPYGCFRSPADDRCATCIGTATDWAVPLCMDERGNVYGYSSVPTPVLSWFHALPESAGAARTWLRRGENGNDVEGWGAAP